MHFAVRNPDFPVCNQKCVLFLLIIFFVITCLCNHATRINSQHFCSFAWELLLNFCAAYQSFPLMRGPEQCNIHSQISESLYGFLLISENFMWLGSIERLIHLSQESGRRLTSNRVKPTRELFCCSKPQQLCRQKKNGFNFLIIIFLFHTALQFLPTLCSIQSLNLFQHACPLETFPLLTICAFGLSSHGCIILNLSKLNFDFPFPPPLLRILLGISLLSLLLTTFHNDQEDCAALLLYRLFNKNCNQSLYNKVF